MLDGLDTRACVELMIDDHQRVPEALHGAAEALAELIDAVTVRARRGGRLIYFGAGTSGRLGVLDASECPPPSKAILRRSSASLPAVIRRCVDRLKAPRMIPMVRSKRWMHCT